MLKLLTGALGYFCLISGIILEMRDYEQALRF